MDDDTLFDVAAEDLTPDQREFLRALRVRMNGPLRPYCCEVTTTTILLVLDLDAPDVALVSVGLEFRSGSLRGDRIGMQDRTFPTAPTADGFQVEGSVEELAARGARLLEAFASRSFLFHQWLHRGRVYATRYLFEDSGEVLSQMYRGDWAPPGQAARLIDEGHVYGRGWVQTSGLGEPDRVFVIREVH